MENTYYHLPREEREACMASLWKWDAGVMREFGWDGAGGCCVTADPENGISMIFTEHLFCWSDAQGTQVHVNMRNAFYEDLFG